MYPYILYTWHRLGESHKIVGYLETYEAMDYELHGLYARALNNLGDYYRAIDVLMKIREEGRNDSIWYYRLAYSYSLLGEEEKAIEIAEKAVELNPDDLDSLELIASGKLYTNQYQDAVHLYEDIIKRKQEKEEKVDAYIYDELEKARFYLKKEEDKKRLSKMQFLFQNGMYKKVKLELQDSYFKDKDFGMLYFQAMYELKEYKNIVHAVKAYDERFKDVDFYVFLSQVYEQLNDSESVLTVQNNIKNMTQDQVQSNQDLMQEKVDAIKSSFNIIRLYIDYDQQVVMILDYTHQDIKDKLESIKKIKPEWKLYPEVLKQVVEKKILELYEGDGLPLKSYVEEDKKLLVYQFPESEENIAFAKTIGDPVIDLFYGDALLRFMESIEEAVNWVDYDVKKRYNFLDETEKHAFSVLSNALHDAKEFEALYALFKHQEKMDLDTELFYVCTLNNVEKYEKAIEQLEALEEEFEKRYGNRHYFNYLSAYAHIGAGNYKEATRFAGLYTNTGQDYFNDSDDDKFIAVLGFLDHGIIYRASHLIETIDMENFTWKEPALNYVFETYPAVKENHEQSKVVDAFIEVFKEDKEKGIAFLKDKKITYVDALISIYNHCVDCEEYEVAHQYLNLAMESARNDYWHACNMMCLVFMEKYEEAEPFYEKALAYLSREYDQNQHNEKTLITYAYACYLKKDLYMVRYILLALWNNKTQAKKQLQAMYEKDRSTALSQEEHELFIEEVKQYGNFYKVERFL